VPNEALAPYYSAADLFCLASDKEGWPNVILESLACETPVVASRVWGIPEIVPDEHIGILALSRTPQDFARSVSIALDRQWDNAALRRYAESRSWDATAKDLHRHFRKVLSNIDTDLGRLDRT
jgi:glycosyltransferase involved in cell wall biosynthesis